MQWDIDNVPEEELQALGITVPGIKFSGTATVTNPDDEGGES
jgi:hypothetical protein